MTRPTLLHQDSQQHHFETSSTFNGRLADIPSMHNHTYMPEGMMHGTLYLGLLQDAHMKEGEIPPHLAPQTNPYFDNTNRTTEDTKYPLLDRNDKR